MKDSEFLEIDDKLHELISQYIDGDVVDNDYFEVRNELIKFIENRRAEQ